MQQKQKPKQKSKPTPIALSRPRAQEILREAAQDSSRVIMTYHALERMEERHITQTGILRILRSGTIIEGPVRNIQKANWECKVAGYDSGENLIVKVAIEHDKNGAIVVTVFWK